MAVWSAATEISGMCDCPGTAQHAAGDSQQVGNLERFHQAEDFGGVHEAAYAGVGNVGEHQHRFGNQAGALLLDPAVNVFARPLARDLAVKKNRVKLIFLQAFNRGRPGGRGGHAQAGGGEYFAFKIEHGLFVVHQEHASLERWTAAGHNSFAFGHRLFAYGRRKDHPDHGPAGRMIVGGNLAAMLLDDAVADAKPQPSALAHALGSVERVKSALGVEEAGTGIVELGDHASVLRAQPDMQVATASAVKHGIGGVVDHVEIHLLHLVWIGHHRSQHRFKLAVHHDVVDL